MLTNEKIGNKFNISSQYSADILNKPRYSSITQEHATAKYRLLPMVVFALFSTMHRLNEAPTKKEQAEIAFGLHILNGVLTRLPEVGLETFAAGSVAKTTDGFLLDLTNALTGKIKFLANFFEGEGMFHPDSEV